MQQRTGSLWWVRLRRGILRVGAALLAAGCAVTAPQGQPVGEPQYDDPPARVGRISHVSGDVTLTDTLHGDQDAATLNWPVTSAQRLTSGPDGVAEVRIGSLAVFLDVSSSVEFSRIDDEAIQILVQQGSVALRTRNRELLGELRIATPREEVVLDDVGRYRVDVDRVPGVTALVTELGHARLVAGGQSFAVAAGQRGEGGNGNFRLVAPQPDGFDNWVAQRDRADEQLYAERYVAPEMTGIESLDEYGTWRTVESYGTVWVPRTIPVGWAPYRFGRWAWIAPWGWTWIDDAPWGFAPFHYGRWVHAGGTWCWVPGAYMRRPVYAPALVAWYGTPGLSISITSGPPIGWFPLGPGDVFVPGYRVSRRYINAINVQHIRHIDRIGVINPPPRYVNQIHPDAVTYAPPRALPGRMRIQEVAVRPPAQETTRVSVQPRPPLTIDDRFSKRRLVPATGGVAAAPGTAVPPNAPAVRTTPGDGRRAASPMPGPDRAAPPARAATPGQQHQERVAPPSIARPPAVQDAPRARPEIVTPPPKQSLVPNPQVAPSQPHTAPQRAVPQPQAPVPQVRPPARVPPAGPRAAPPVRAPQPPPAAPTVNSLPRQGAAAPRAVPAPPVVRQPAPPTAEPRVRAPVAKEPSVRTEGPQRAGTRAR